MPGTESSSNKPRVPPVCLVPGYKDEQPRGPRCCGTQHILPPPLPFLCGGREKWEVWAHGGFWGWEVGGSVGSFSSSQWWAPERQECRRSLLPVAIAGWKGITHRVFKKGRRSHTYTHIRARTHRHTISNITNFFQSSKQSWAGGNRTWRTHNGSSFN